MIRRALVVAALVASSVAASAVVATPASATECTPKGCTGGCRLNNPVPPDFDPTNPNIALERPIECYS